MIKRLNIGITPMEMYNLHFKGWNESFFIKSKSC